MEEWTDLVVSTWGHQQSPTVVALQAFAALRFTSTCSTVPTFLGERSPEGADFDGEISDLVTSWDIPHLF